MKSEQAYIVGTGIVSPAGSGVDPFWAAVRNGDSLLSKDENSYTTGAIGAVQRKALREQLSNNHLIKQLTERASGMPVFDAHYFTVAALQEAMAQAGWDSLTADDGLILATTTGQVPLWEQDLIDYLGDVITDDELAKTFSQQTLGVTLRQISDALEFNGKATLVTSACSASSQALVLAHKWLRQGKVKRVLVGATELLCTLTLRGFASFQLLAEEGARPFDKRRTGINLSEGAGFICLEAQPTDRSLATFAGGGFTVDAYHMTAPEPEGKGCAKAMLAALDDADMNARDIDWVHAHGTGSVHNDAAESQAIAQTLGLDVPVSSTKAIHGHPLAASGIMEAVLDVCALREGYIPGTVPGLERGEDIRINALAAPREGPVQAIMKNALGFGGTNCSFIIRKNEGELG